MNENRNAGKDVRVSVVMLCYNHEPYIRKALDHVLSQETDFGVRLVVHDDASTDRSGEILREYAAAHPEIVPLIEPENCQMHHRPFSLPILPHIAGDYVAFCECDDYWTDDHKLQMQVDFMDAHPDVSSTYHNCTLIYEGDVDDEARKNKELRYGHRPEGEYTPDDFAAFNGLPGHTASILERYEVYKTKCDPDCALNRTKMNGDMKNLTVALSLGKVYTLEPVMSAHRVVVGHGTSWSQFAAKSNLTGESFLEALTIRNYLEERTGQKFHNDRSILSRGKRLFENGVFRPSVNRNREVFRETMEKIGGTGKFFSIMAGCAVNESARVIKKKFTDGRK